MDTSSLALDTVATGIYAERRQQFVQLAASDGSPFKLIGRTLRRLGDRIGASWRLHREHKELTGMSDCELEDIGITRNDIPVVVIGVYRREWPVRSPAIR